MLLQLRPERLLCLEIHKVSVFGCSGYHAIDIPYSCFWTTYVGMIPGGNCNNMPFLHNDRTLFLLKIIIHTLHSKPILHSKIAVHFLSFVAMLMRRPCSPSPQRSVADANQEATGIKSLIDHIPDMPKGAILLASVRLMPRVSIYVGKFDMCECCLTGTGSPKACDNTILASQCQRLVDRQVQHITQYCMTGLTGLRGKCYGPPLR